jgi:hypothetical protein
MKTYRLREIGSGDYKEYQIEGEIQLGSGSPEVGHIDIIEGAVTISFMDKFIVNKRGETIYVKKFNNLTKIRYS